VAAGAARLTETGRAANRAANDLALRIAAQFGRERVELRLVRLFSRLETEDERKMSAPATSAPLI
jgi:hypothetical protein